MRSPELRVGGDLQLEIEWVETGAPRPTRVSAPHQLALGILPMDGTSTRRPAEEILHPNQLWLGWIDSGRYLSGWHESS